MNFQGKVAVVTGGGSGIGRATVREFARRGASVAVVDREDQAGRLTVEELRLDNFATEFFRADVSVRAEVEQLVSQVASRMGGIDVLVNNVGIQRYGTSLSTSEEVWEEVMAVNAKSVFLMSKHVIPEMIKRGGGAIVNTGSVQSLSALVNSVAYVASKHAVLGLTRAMALDHARDNIRVNCVCPGAIDTPMLRWAASLSDEPQRVLEACARAHALGRVGRPEEVARLIVFLASDWASFITGENVLVDGGMLVAAGGVSFQQEGTGGAAESG